MRPDGRARHQPGVLRRRAGAGRQPRRRREQRLDAHHQPAQPRAGHAVLVGDDRASATTDVRQWAQETKLADGRRVIDQEWVQLNLARVHARLEFLRLINWKVAWDAHRRATLDIADASTIKVFGTEFYLEAFRLLMEIIGPAGVPAPRARPSAVLALPARAHLPQPHHPHVRRRRQRGAARPDRRVRPRHAHGGPALEGDSTPWTSRSPKSRRPSSDLAAQILGDQRHHERAQGARGRRRRSSTATRGRRWPRPGCSASRCPRTSAAAASASSRPASCSEQVGRTAAPVPVLRHVVLGALPIAEFGRPSSGRRSCPASSPATRCSPPRSSRSAPTRSHPSTTATRDGDGWVLDGAKTCVPAGPGRRRDPRARARRRRHGRACSSSTRRRRASRCERQDTTTGIPEARLDARRRAGRGADVLGDAAPTAPSSSGLVERGHRRAVRDRHRRVRGRRCA